MCVYIQTQTRKADWEGREEEVQRLRRNFEERLAVQRQLLLDAHRAELQTSQKVRGCCLLNVQSC